MNMPIVFLSIVFCFLWGFFVGISLDAIGRLLQSIYQQKNHCLKRAQASINTNKNIG